MSTWIGSPFKPSLRNSSSPVSNTRPPAKGVWTQSLHMSFDEHGSPCSKLLLLPYRMNSIFQLHRFTSRLYESLNPLQIADFARFEPLRIMKDKSRVFGGCDFLLDITYTMTLVGYGLSIQMMFILRSDKKVICLTASETLKAWLISEDFPVPDYILNRR